MIWKSSECIGEICEQLYKRIYCNNHGTMVYTTLGILGDAEMEEDVHADMDSVF